MNEAEVQPQEVRAHLDRVMASKIFAESERLRRFLRFTVESKLDERHDRVKEYVLGREVFDRQDGYDPRVDPIVRVEARRLRAKLLEYYSGAGRDEPVRLEYHKGSYLPTFSRANQRSAGLQRFASRNVLTACAALAIVIAGLAFYFIFRSSPNTSMVAAVPARWIEPNPGDLNAADVGLAEAVNSELANRQVVKVLAWPLILQHQNQRKPLRELARDMGVGKLLVIVVRDVPASKRITVFLIDSNTGRKLRANDYLRHDLSSLSSQQALARQIASDLGKALQT